jgi:hypothetical protein
MRGRRSQQRRVGGDRHDDDIDIGLGLGNDIGLVIDNDGSGGGGRQSDAAHPIRSNDWARPQRDVDPCDVPTGRDARRLADLSPHERQAG